MAAPRSKLGKASGPVSTPPDMTTAADAGKVARHVYGPRTLSIVLPAILKPVFANHPAATAQVIADWALIVGQTMAAITQPRRLSGGTLSVSCTGPAAMELQHVGDMLIGRINQHLGHAVVQRLRIVQDFVRPAPTPSLPPSISAPQDRAAAEQRLGDFAPGPLRDALATLGSKLVRR